MMRLINIFVLGMITLLTGCGETKLNTISGSVIFNEAPLKKGTITFIAQDNNQKQPITIPPTSISIIDGKYTIPSRYGLSSGITYDVYVEGFDGIATETSPVGLSLFPKYNTIFIYEDQKTFDIIIPLIKKTSQ
jgi:hypothetical protein